MPQIRAESDEVPLTITILLVLYCNRVCCLHINVVQLFAAVRGDSCSSSMEMNPVLDKGTPKSAAATSVMLHPWCSSLIAGPPHCSSSKQRN